jgi:hypothetical protein
MDSTNDVEHEGARDLPWTEPGWKDRIRDWAIRELTDQKISITGPIEFIHMRAWSAFASLPTTYGVFYLKAPAPSLMHEARLTQTLAHLRPDCMAELISIEPSEGWMLSAHSGDMLRNHIKTVDDLHHWDQILPLYAEFQMELADHCEEIMVTGIPDRRLEIFPGLYESLLEDVVNLRVDNPPGLSGEEHRRLLDLRPQVTALCEELAGLQLPETVCHEEVHDGNILINDNRYIFVDWSDSSFGHPFFTMLVTLRHTAYRMELDESAPEISRMRDIYLEPWTRYHPSTKLREAFAIAYRLAMIDRSLSY